METRFSLPSGCTKLDVTVVRKGNTMKKSTRKQIRELTEEIKPRDPVVRAMIKRGQKAGLHASSSKRARDNKYRCRGKVRQDD